MLLALTPATVAALWFYRLPALWLIAVSVTAAVAAEALWQKAFKKPVKIKDLSAAVTGLLFGLSLSPSVPLPVAAAGAAFAIIVGKQFFGGFGKNLFNPALTGRLFVVLAFPGVMRPWLDPVQMTTAATPLQVFRAEGLTAPLAAIFVGNVPGSIGETSALALLLGFVWLAYKKFANWRIPAACLSATAVIALAAGDDPLFHLMSGSLLLGALLMATDPVTSPRTQTGRWLFGAAVGAGTMAMRYWSPLPEGTTFAILACNAVVPLINRLTLPSSSRGPGR
jgi:electron transport complex protein RnfD